MAPANTAVVGALWGGFIPVTGLHLGPGLLRTSFGIWIHEMYMKQLNCCSWREVYCNSQGPHSSLLLLPLNLCEFTHLSHLFSRKKMHGACIQCMTIVKYFYHCSYMQWSSGLKPSQSVHMLAGFIISIATRNFSFAVISLNLPSTGLKLTAVKCFAHNERTNREQATAA